jgi:membrane protease YdiL (CAAX protease family)
MPVELTEPTVTGQPIRQSELVSEVQNSLPKLTLEKVWFELGAVLAVGVIPNLGNALLAEPFALNNLPVFWRGCLSSIVSSTCTIFVVLYLISRSGETWERFGLSRPRKMDFVIGFVMLLASVELWQIYPVFRSLDEGLSRVQWFTYARRGDLPLAGLTFVFTAFSEELVTRAYLITRLEELLRSRTFALLIAALLFASYHIYQGYNAVGATFAFGLLYGGAFLFVRRVWPLVLGHALSNLLVTWQNLPVS